MDIDAHAKYVHSALVSQPAATVLRSKPSALPRPIIDEDIMEEERKHFNEKWSRYKQLCLSDSTEEHVMDQLWAVCSESLENTVFKSKGANPANDEATLLDIVKEFAVRK